MIVCYDALRKIWRRDGGFKCGALRNANEKIENALIDIASPKTSRAIGALMIPSA